VGGNKHVLNTMCDNTYTQFKFEEYGRIVTIKFVCNVIIYKINKSQLFMSFASDNRRSIAAGTEITQKNTHKCCKYFQFSTVNHKCHSQNSEVRSNNFQVVYIYGDTN
jgi:hypothetical protein